MYKKKEDKSEIDEFFVCLFVSLFNEITKVTTKDERRDDNL